MLDDTLSDAHAVLGAIKAMHGWDWGAGEEHLKRALELNPNDFRAHQILGGIFRRQRRWDEALEEYKKAEEELAELYILWEGKVSNFVKRKVLESYKNGAQTARNQMKKDSSHKSQGSK